MTGTPITPEENEAMNRMTAENLRTEARRANEAKLKAEARLEQRDASVLNILAGWAQIPDAIRIGCALSILLGLAGLLGVVVYIWRAALSLR